MDFAYNFKIFKIRFSNKIVNTNIIIQAAVMLVTNLLKNNKLQSEPQPNSYNK